MLPPETRRHKIELSRRKSWCESDDPAFAAKAADIVRLYMARPRTTSTPSSPPTADEDMTVGTPAHLGVAGMWRFTAATST
jgi:hypothetical protein